MNDAGLELVDNQSIAAGDLVAATYLVSQALDLGDGSSPVVPLDGAWIVIAATEDSVEASTAVACDIKLISCTTDDLGTNFILSNYVLHYQNSVRALFKREGALNPVIAFQIPVRPRFSRYMGVVLTFSGGTGLTSGRLNMTIQAHAPYRALANGI